MAHMYIQESEARRDPQYTSEARRDPQYTQLSRLMNLEKLFLFRFVGEGMGLGMGLFNLVPDFFLLFFRCNFGEVVKKVEANLSAAAALASSSSVDNLKKNVFKIFEKFKKCSY
jgi:hypothetical protein